MHGICPCLALCVVDQASTALGYPYPFGRDRVRSFGMICGRGVMGHGQTDRAVSGDVVVMAGAVPEIAPKGPSMPGFIDLYRATNLMQEAALVLTYGASGTDSAI